MGPPTCSEAGAEPTQRRKARPGFRGILREYALNISSYSQQMSLTETCACNYRGNYYFNTNQQLIKILPSTEDAPSSLQDYRCRVEAATPPCPVGQDHGNFGG